MNCEGNLETKDMLKRLLCRRGAKNVGDLVDARAIAARVCLIKKEHTENCKILCSRMLVQTVCPEKEPMFDRIWPIPDSHHIFNVQITSSIMSYKRLPGYNRYKSAYETRRIIAATKSLEEDIELLDDELYRHKNGMAFRGIDDLSDLEAGILYDPDCSPVTDQECLEGFIDANFQYQNYLVKNLPILRHLIHPKYIERYFDTLSRFDRIVHSIDETYPVLPQANL